LLVAPAGGPAGRMLAYQLAMASAGRCRLLPAGRLPRIKSFRCCLPQSPPSNICS